MRKGDAGDDVQLILPPKKPKTDEELEKESSPRKDSGQVDVVPGTEQKVEVMFNFLVMAYVHSAKYACLAFQLLLTLQTCYSYQIADSYKA